MAHSTGYYRGRKENKEWIRKGIGGYEIYSCEEVKERRLQMGTSVMYGVGALRRREKTLVGGMCLCGAGK